MKNFNFKKDGKMLAHVIYIIFRQLNVLFTKINRNEIGVIILNKLLIKKLENLKNGHEIGRLCVYVSDRTRRYIDECKNNNKPIDFKLLNELRKQWAFDFRLDNNL